MLKLLHTSYISLLNHAEKGWVFYSFDKCFETGADPQGRSTQLLRQANFGNFDTTFLSEFYCVISRVTFAWSLKARVIARFSKSARARSKDLCFFLRAMTNSLTFRSTLFCVNFFRMNRSCCSKSYQSKNKGPQCVHVWLTKLSCFNWH